MKQKYLGKGGLILLITLLSMIPPLSTDLYMPSLPEITIDFNTTSTLTSFTMTIFFICMALGILLLGPQSDKFGRKPVLIFSVSMTVIFSLACAFSPSITLFIIFRALQALGAGGMVSIATALVKDSFSGKEMSQVLSITQVLMLLAPMCAPVLGAFIITYFDWEMTFIALALLNTISLVCTFLLQETLPVEKRTNTNVFTSIKGLFLVAKNKQFVSLLLIGGFLTAPYMAYLSVASYVYISQFGTTETQFSLFFALNAAFALIGPFLFMKFGKQAFKRVITVAITIVVISGILLLTLGQISPVLFLISFLPFTILGTYFRPYISENLLKTLNENVGAGSSLMNFGFTILGSSAMFIGSLKWGNYIVGLASTILIYVFITFLCLLFVKQKRYINLNDSQKESEAQ